MQIKIMMGHGIVGAKIPVSESGFVSDSDTKSEFKLCPLLN